MAPPDRSNATSQRSGEHLAPDAEAEPQGFVVEVGADRIHFLDWGGPADGAGVLLIHGLGQTAWEWAPVARRLRRVARVVAMDLRGHGLSDAPTHGYEPEKLVEDVEAVADGAGIGADRILLGGHGFGACVAGWAAGRMGRRVAALALVDGGIEDVADIAETTPEEWLKTIGDPPETLRSMAAFLADRRGYDPASWDADQERAARSTVVQVPAGHLVPAIHPHALEGCVRTLFAYRPRDVLAGVRVPVLALLAGDDSPERAEALGELQLDRERAGAPRIEVRRYRGAGHNLMRYRPVEVAGELVGLMGTRG